MNVLFFTRESAFLIVNIFMLKNLAIYVMFKAKTDDEEAKAKQLLRSFCWTYLAVLFVFELVNAYLSIEVFCIGCRHPGDGAAALFFTLNIAKFLLNLVLVVISFMHSVHLTGALSEYNESLKSSIQDEILTDGTSIAKESMISEKPSSQTPMDNDAYRSRVAAMRNLYLSMGITFLLINILYTIIIPFTIVTAMPPKDQPD